jgi:hypothetical protein
VALVSPFHCLLDDKFNGKDELLVNIFHYLGAVDVVKLQRVSKDVRNAVKKTLGQLDIQDITSIFGFIGPKIANSIRDNPLPPITDFGGRFGRFGNNELANIFSFLHTDEVMLFRQVCKKWNEAVNTLPIGYFLVDGPEKYMAMIATLRALPNLERVSLEYLGRGVYTPPHDREEWVMMASQDHELLRGRLYSLTISDMFHSVSSDYSVSFDYPHLEKLVIANCPYLEWDLMTLVGLPSLTELICIDNSSLTGNIHDLRVLKETLAKVVIYTCENVEGNFMDLADFPRLRELNLTGTAVSGDIRDIDENNFLDLTELDLPENVYGGNGYVFPTISTVHDFFQGLDARVIRLLATCTYNYKDYVSYLWRDSPCWYSGQDSDIFPFKVVKLVRAGSRLGWRLEGSEFEYVCEVTWLDYKDYITDYNIIQQRVDCQGFRELPTEEEYYLYISLENLCLW